MTYTGAKRIFARYPVRSLGANLLQSATWKIVGHDEKKRPGNGPNLHKRNFIFWACGNFSPNGKGASLSIHSIVMGRFRFLSRYRPSAFGFCRFSKVCLVFGFLNIVVSVFSFCTVMNYPYFIILWCLIATSRPSPLSKQASIFISQNIYIYKITNE